MDSISLVASVTLTGKSKRTLWRRVADGSLPRAPDDAQGRARVLWRAVAAEACLPLTEAEGVRLRAADAGDADAQAEVAQWFLAAGRPEAAVYWLEQAARQRHADAMHWLAHCCFGGHGLPRNDAQGLVWLGRAASLGHAIAETQLAGLRARLQAAPSAPTGTAASGG